MGGGLRREGFVTLVWYAAQERVREGHGIAFVCRCSYAVQGKADLSSQHKVSNILLGYPGIPMSTLSPLCLFATGNTFPLEQLPFTHIALT